MANDIRSQRWKAILDDGDNRPDSTDVDIAHGVVDGDDAVDSAACFVRLKDGRHMFLERSADGLTENAVIGPRGKCEQAMARQTKTRLGLP